ncbi:MAG TPA: PEP/pyruvate-binding domain-containing protein, partial [Candidatus Paceibacterota bacterium]|nr:PEP/pyruvate-binding domain-containing protein [Candidatus Paceibacterota bacterium]
MIALYDKPPDSSEYASLLKEIKQNLVATRFAVRSSALIEDSNKTSYAGQFLTKIDLEIANVADAINQVITQAHEKLHGKLELFSIIVQEYVAADTAGVCFTRDPLGSRNMVIEYHQGIGEDIVSGKVKPKRISVYWNSRPNQEWDKSVAAFKSIEQAYKTPQDIEWLSRNNQLYIVQTRPITTIDDRQYQGLLYLDEILPDEPFIYEKTEISEIAPRPTPFTYDLLQKIYTLGGPVDSVYKKYGINFTPDDFLEIIGNELYVNREKEIHTLLPSYTYLKKGTPGLASLKGIGRTIGNIFRLNRVRRDPAVLYENLHAALQEELILDQHLLD